jgi:hypothetical protein
LLFASLAVTGALGMKKVDIEHSRHVPASAGDNQNSIVAQMKHMQIANMHN